MFALSLFRHTEIGRQSIHPINNTEHLFRRSGSNWAAPDGMLMTPEQTYGATR
ncbi:MAG: hypothetical protein ACI8PQ_003474, partial [Planctomycetota bacterium]